MNLEQLQEKAQEILKSYRQIDRDQDELETAVRRFVRISRNIRRRTGRFQRRRERAGNMLSRRSRQSWKNGKQKRAAKQSENWSRSVWIYAALEQQKCSSFRRKSKPYLHQRTKLCNEGKPSRPAYKLWKQSGDEISRKEGRHPGHSEKRFRRCRRNRSERLAGTEAEMLGRKEERTEQPLRHFLKSEMQLSEQISRTG